MATNFAAVGLVSIKTDAGDYLIGIFNRSNLTTKRCFDQVLPAGTFDFAPLLLDATKTLRGLLVVSDGDFLLSIDGINFGPRKHKILFLTFDDVGVQPLKITLTGQSRVQMMAVGD